MKAPKNKSGELKGKYFQWKRSTKSLIEKKLEMSCEMNELRKENKDTKILLYMIIHDLKHPTDSLVISVANSLEQLARAKEMLEII